MSLPATGSVYSVGTFLVLAGAFLLVTGWLFGWEAVPINDRAQAATLLLWYSLAGYFALLVGRHRDVPYSEALRRGAIDVGRAIKRLVLR